MKLIYLICCAAVASATHSLAQINFQDVSQDNLDAFLSNGLSVFKDEEVPEVAVQNCYNYCLSLPRCWSFMIFNYPKMACAIFSMRCKGAKPIPGDDDIEDFVLKQSQASEEVETSQQFTKKLNPMQSSVSSGNYLAYSFFPPNLPDYGHLSPSRYITNFDDFESREQWSLELRYDWFNDVRESVYEGGSLLPMRITSVIEKSFIVRGLTPMKTLPESRFSFTKAEITQSIRRLLKKMPIDEKTVYASLVAFMNYQNLDTYSSINPRTLEDINPTGNLDKITQIIQPLLLSQNHWIVIRWQSELTEDYVDIYTTKAMDGNPLEHPVIKDFFTRVSVKFNPHLRIPRNEQVNLSLVDDCPENDTSLCAMHIFATWSFGDTRETWKMRFGDTSWVPDDHPYPNLFMPEDDFRLWVAYVMMKHYNITADDIYAGLNKFNKDYIPGDVTFRFS